MALTGKERHEFIERELTKIRERINEYKHDSRVGDRDGLECE